MSHIPNNAIPHAQASDAEQANQAETSGSAFGQIADKAREYPKTAIAAGAAVAAGVVAAAAIGVRGRGQGKGRGKKEA